MQTLALAPKGLAPFGALSAYARYQSDLSPLQRELAIIIAVRDVHYGWTHHEPLARATGLNDQQLLLIRDGRVPKDLPPAEHALADYAFEITAGRRVPPRVAEAVRANFSPRQIVDIALLTSFAMASAALTLALEVPLEPRETLAFEQEWQQTRDLSAVA
jgi:4-carboxymuconolactone decarboxylase